MQESSSIPSAWFPGISPVALLHGAGQSPVPIVATETHGLSVLRAAGGLSTTRGNVSPNVWLTRGSQGFRRGGPAPRPGAQVTHLIVNRVSAPGAPPPLQFSGILDPQFPTCIIIPFCYVERMCFFGGFFGVFLCFFACFRMYCLIEFIVLCIFLTRCF